VLEEPDDDEPEDPVDDEDEEDDEEEPESPEPLLDPSEAAGVDDVDSEPDAPVFAPERLSLR
jgi:hypothetical protein